MPDIATRILTVRRAIVVASLLVLVVPGCDRPHSHTDQAVQSHEHAENDAAPAPDLETASSTDPDDIGARPFLAKATVIDGAILEGARNMMLVVDTALPSETEPDSRGAPMVLFLQRAGTADAHVGSWDSVALGSPIRSETYTFDDKSITIENLPSEGGRRTREVAVFRSSGDVIQSESGGFETTVSRERGQLLRVRRRMSGTASGPLLCGVSRVIVFRWDAMRWEVNGQRLDFLNIGIRTPTESTQSVDGQWQSINLTGPVQRRTWNLNGGRFVSSPAGGKPGRVQDPWTGTYTVGAHGKVVLTSEGPATVTRRGTLDPKSHGGFVLLEGPVTYSRASFWWQRADEGEHDSLEGSWHVFGHLPTIFEDGSQEMEIVTGSAEISSDGTMTGHFGILDAGQTIRFGGELKPGTRPTGFFDLEIPIDFRQDPTPASKAHAH